MTDEERKALVERLSHELTDFMNPFGMSANTAALCLLPIIEKLREADGKRIAELERLDKELDLMATAFASSVEEKKKRIAELEAALRDVIECDPGSYEATIARAALGEKV